MGNFERFMQVVIEKDNDWMTPEKCIHKCDQKGFAFAGVDKGFSRFFCVNYRLILTAKDSLWFR